MAGTEEAAPALGAKYAALQAYAPVGGQSGFQEGDRSAADDEWMKHAIPGDTIPSSAIAASSADWSRIEGRPEWGNGGAKWKPLGPTWAKGLPNPYRDRSVYNGGTPDFSGRIAHVVIDPNCGSRDRSDIRSRRGDDDRGRGRGDCRMWIANANGGVWRTDDALERTPEWEYLSESFEHNSIASLELDPNDPRSNTIWAGTGEPNACGSGCEAGVGLYKSTNGGESWKGPYGQTSGAACGPGNPSPCNPFYNRAVGSIQVKPGNSNVIFAASGRAIRGLTSSCCGGADALIPGAAHFGLYRSLDGGQNWQLVHQGAATDCTASHPDTVSLSGTPCSPRGARRVMFDPVDPNTVYVGFFGRGIWRSRANGDPGTWEQIMLPVTPVPNTAGGGTERPEFDLVKLPSGETRMYVGVGGGGVFARFRRNEAVRTTPALGVQASWIDLSNPVPDTPGFSSAGYCDGQCSYDNYVFAPAGHFPNSGASVDTVYLSGANRYGENDWGPASPRANIPGNVTGNGRDNARGVAMSTNAGVSFYDMTDDDSDDFYPVELHPDHHALTVNPRNWKQFFDVGDGGIVRSNGTFVDDSGDCTNPKGYVGAQLAFCKVVLSRVPERLTTLNKGLRTLHFYQIAVSPHDPDVVAGGTQDNGSWERTSGDTWVNTNIADGGHNNFDIADPHFRQTGFQQGQLMVAYNPRDQVDQNWIADTLFVFYGNEGVPFIGPATTDPTHAGWIWTAREHVFRSTNYGRNPVMTKEQHRKHCNIWYGDADVNESGAYEPALDICDDFKPLGDPGVAGRLTNASFGASKAGGTVAAVEPAHDGKTLWAATSTGRIFVSTNSDNANAATVVFDRIDDEAANTPNRYPTAIHVDPEDANHAWITFSGFNAKTPTTPGHVFEVRYVPGASTFTVLDGATFGDIPATSIAVTNDGLIVVGTDYGAVSSTGDGNWTEAGKGLPNVVVSDLVYVPSRDLVYAGTHGQGAWTLRVK